MAERRLRLASHTFFHHMYHHSDITRHEVYDTARLESGVYGKEQATRSGRVTQLSKHPLSLFQGFSAEILYIILVGLGCGGLYHIGWRHR